MQPIEQVELLFEEIKKGNNKVIDEFCEACWTNFTRLAHDAKAKASLAKIYDWAKTNATTRPEFFALINLTIGSIEFLADNFDDAMKYLNAAQQLFSDRKDEDGVAASYIFIGFLYRSKGEIDLALKYGLEGIEQLAHTVKYKMFQIIGFYWIGGVYADTGHLDEALSFFQRGLKVDYPPGIRNMEARLTNGIAGVYMKQNKFSLALDNYQKALSLCGDSPNNTVEATFKARGLTDLGDYYYKMGNYAEAIRYNEEALALRQEMKILNGSITNFMNLGNIYDKNGKFNEAIAVLTKALKLSEEIGVKAKMYQIHQLLSDIYLNMGNMSESMAHYKAFHEIREEVNHDDMERKVKNQVELFQAEQTKKENVVIKAQKKEIEIKNIELQDTIDELTLARVSKKAKALTLGLAIILFIFEDPILGFALKILSSNSYFLGLFIKITIIFSLSPINKAIENYLLKRVIKRKKPLLVPVIE